jgi:hypothetical protein
MRGKSTRAPLSLAVIFIIQYYSTMENKKKILISKWLIFVSLFSFFAILILGYTGFFPEFNSFNSYSTFETLFDLTICTLFLVGLYLGSRGLGVPLSFELFLKLLFSPPTKYILVPFLVLIVAKIIYLEIFW